MGLFLRQDEGRSELQSRLAAELQERLKERPDLKADKPDPAFLENQHQTRPAGMVLIVLGVLLVIAIIFFALHVGGVV